MKYKIIVDKQPRTNPSTERREYEIDVNELCCKGNVCDTLVITKDEDYIIRRLNLSDLHVLTVLSEPVKELIPNVNIELFEGDNYIYVQDMSGNKFYAEYLVKNDFTDMYVTVNQMNSFVEQTAGKIELTVNQTLKEYATSEELEGAVTTLNSTITQTADEINIEVSKKVNDEDLTGANILLKINNDESEAQIKADKISLNGKTLNLADNMAIISNKFNVDKNGKMTCSDALITGGRIDLTDTDLVAFQIHGKTNSSDTYFSSDSGQVGNYVTLGTMDDNHGFIALSGDDYTNIQSTGITTPQISTSNLTVTGSKNRAVKIDNNSYVLLNAYETATPYFGDIGSNKTDNNGYCRIEIEDVFKRTIEMEDYKVFIQECGNGKLYVKKQNNYFEVLGTPNLDFDWEIKAIQKGYKDTRLAHWESKIIKEGQNGKN